MKAALTPQARQRLRNRVEDMQPHQPEIAEVLGVLLDESERWDAIAAALVDYERRVEALEKAERDAVVYREILQNLRERGALLERHGELFGPEEPADYEVEERRVERGPDVLRSGVPLTQAAPVVCGYAVNLPVHTLNVKG